MELNYLKKVLKDNFTLFSETDYHDYACSPRKARRYFHNEEEFQIIVFQENNDVYQVGTEADTIGVELKTIGALRTRYKSFTGEKLK